MSHVSPLLDQKLESSKENLNEEKIQRLPYDKSVFWTGLIGMILCLAPGGIIGLVLIKISLNRAKQPISFLKKILIFTLILRLVK